MKERHSKSFRPLRQKKKNDKKFSTSRTFRTNDELEKWVEQKALLSSKTISRFIFDILDNERQREIEEVKEWKQRIKK